MMIQQTQLNLDFALFRHEPTEIERDSNDVWRGDNVPIRLSIFGEVLSPEVRQQDPFGRPIYTVDHSIQGEVNFIITDSMAKIFISAETVGRIQQQSNIYQPLVNNEGVPLYCFDSGKWKKLSYLATDQKGITMYQIGERRDCLLIFDPAESEKGYQFRTIGDGVYAKILTYSAQLKKMAAKEEQNL